MATKLDLTQLRNVAETGVKILSFYIPMLNPKKAPKLL